MNKNSGFFCSALKKKLNKLWKNCSFKRNNKFFFTAFSYFKKKILLILKQIRNQYQFKLKIQNIKKTPN